MKGISDGNKTCRMVFDRDTWNDRDMSNSSRGVSRTPSRMLMITKGIPVRTTTMMGPVFPKPKAMLTNSAQARLGIASTATTQSLKKALVPLDIPMARPITVPRPMAISHPTKRRFSEIQKVSKTLYGANVSSRSSSQMKSRTSDGRGRTSTANGHACWISSMLTSQNTSTATGKSRRAVRGDRSTRIDVFKTSPSGRREPAPPPEEVALDLLQDHLLQEQGEQVEGQDPGEEDVELEQLLGHPHLEADAGRRGEDLGEHHDLPGDREAEPHPGEDVGGQVGNHDLPVALHDADPERLAHVDQVLRQRLDPFVDVDGDQGEGRQHHRDERTGRAVAEDDGGDQGPDQPGGRDPDEHRVLEEALEPSVLHEDADGQPDHEGQREAHRDARQGGLERARHVALGPDLPEGAQHLGWRREELLAHPVTGRVLPDAQHRHVAHDPPEPDDRAVAPAVSPDDVLRGDPGFGETLVGRRGRRHTSSSRRWAPAVARGPRPTPPGAWTRIIRRVVRSPRTAVPGSRGRGSCRCPR